MENKDLDYIEKMVKQINKDKRINIEQIHKSMELIEVLLEVVEGQYKALKLLGFRDEKEVQEVDGETMSFCEVVKGTIQQYKEVLLNLSKR